MRNRPRYSSTYPFDAFVVQRIDDGGAVIGEPRSLGALIDSNLEDTMGEHPSAAQVHDWLNKLARDRGFVDGGGAAGNFVFHASEGPTDVFAGLSALPIDSPRRPLVVDLGDGEGLLFVDRATGRPMTSPVDVRSQDPHEETVFDVEGYLDRHVRLPADWIVPLDEIEMIAGHSMPGHR